MMKNKIDTTKWKNFVIEDLFDIKRPSARSQSDYEEGEIPFIASGNYNNGVLKYLMPKGNEVLDKGNCITVSPVDGSAFYQKEDFLGRGGAGSSIILLYNEHLNEKNGTFIATIIRKICSKYGYSDMGSKESIRKEIIKLPVDNKDNPDWNYMERYMKNIEKQSKESIKKLISCKEESNKLDITKWGEFKIGNIFNIVSPKVYHTREVKKDINGIPYVVRSKFNNGIKYMVERDEKFVVNPKGVISFGAENASFFYQDKEYISGRDMYYIDTRNLSRNTALFIIACLEKLTSKYSYNFGLFPKLLKEEKIKLPIKNNGKPDYEYMDKYMNELLNKTKNKLNCLNDI